MKVQPFRTKGEQLNNCQTPTPMIHTPHSNHVSCHGSQNFVTIFLESESVLPGILDSGAPPDCTFYNTKFRFLKYAPYFRWSKVTRHFQLLPDSITSIHFRFSVQPHGRGVHVKRNQKNSRRLYLYFLYCHSMKCELSQGISLIITTFITSTGVKTINL